MFERQNRLSQTIYYKVISHFISNSNHGLNAKLKQYFLIKMSKPNDKLRKIPVINSCDAITSYLFAKVNER